MSGDFRDILTEFSHVATHPMDDHMAVISSAQDIPVIKGSKGLLWEDAMPEEPMDFFLNVRERELKKLYDCIRLNTETGEPEFSADYINILPQHVRDFITEVSMEFNKVGPWPASFEICPMQAHRYLATSFHFDTEFASEPRQTRLLITVSEDPDEREYETEWVAMNGLNHEDMRLLYREDKPAEELSEHLRPHVHHVKSGDMIGIGSLGEESQDSLVDACLHRAPGNKIATREDGNKRTSLSWGRILEP